jgi:biopolymer transport protein ExbB/TolQ
MSSLLSAKNKMLFVLALVLFALTACYKLFIGIFMYNPTINAIILSCFFIGLITPFLGVRALNADKCFLSSFVSDAGAIPPKPSILSKLLLEERGDFRRFFSANDVQTMTTCVERHLSSRHTVSRYFVGLLVLLGLLGTFLGLTQTVGSISNTMNNLAVSNLGGDSFNTLLDGIRSPLSGMGVAFSSSILGLIGSLILGLFDLLQGKDEKDFFDILETELFKRVKSSGAFADGQAPASNGPAYVWALLEQTVEVMNAVSERMRQTEDNRFSVVSMMQEVADALRSSFAKESAQLAEVQAVGMRINAALEQIGHALEDNSSKMTALHDISALKNVQNKVLEELIDGRKQMTQELKTEIRMIVKTLSMLSDEPMSAVGQ